MSPASKNTIWDWFDIYIEEFGFEFYEYNINYGIHKRHFL